MRPLQPLAHATESVCGWKKFRRFLASFVSPEKVCPRPRPELGTKKLAGGDVHYAGIIKTMGKHGQSLEFALNIKTKGQTGKAPLEANKDNYYENLW